MDPATIKLIPAVTGGVLGILNVIWGLIQQLGGDRSLSPVDREKSQIHGEKIHDEQIPDKRNPDIQIQTELRSLRTIRGAFVAFAGMVVVILIFLYGIYHSVVQTVLIMCGAALLFLALSAGRPLPIRPRQALRQRPVGLLLEALSGLYFILFALLN